MQLILNNQLWRIKRLTCFYYTCIQSIFCMGEISGETIFIDGTKIEASANKYTFVWKKAVTKNQAKLLQKLADFVAECELLYDIKIVYGNTIKIKHVKKLRKKLYALKETENIVFVHGIGKRKTPLQKSIETLESYLNQLKKYNQQIHICAGRNSYSKTDHDATFMRMKEDAMGNGQLKPAYNLQHGVDSEYITWLTIGPQPTDTTTLIPFLKDYTKEGVFKVLCTDISRDGMLQGPSVELYQQILKEFPNMHLIASGGVSCIQDIIDLEIAKVPAVVFGKALYEGKITLKDLNRFM